MRKKKPFSLSCRLCGRLHGGSNLEGQVLASVGVVRGTHGRGGVCSRPSADGTFHYAGDDRADVGARPWPEVRPSVAGDIPAAGPGGAAGVQRGRRPRVCFPLRSATSAYPPPMDVGRLGPVGTTSPIGLSRISGGWPSYILSVSILWSTSTGRGQAVDGELKISAFILPDMLKVAGRPSGCENGGRCRRSRLKPNLRVRA